MANKDGKPFGYHKKKSYRLGKAFNFSNNERLISCAIVRNGTLQVGFKSHSELRASLGDVDPYAQKLRPADIEGFFTSKDRFVTREQAKIVGEAAGQCRPMVRELLSSDITWD